MPKENKHSRGRPEEKKLKRKRENGENVEQESKKQKSQNPAEYVALNGDESAEMPDVAEDGAEVAERPFYGMLEDEEQEYFRRADELLELNDFPSSEERAIFLSSVYKEAEGKELKIACSQSCSRLMERLILLSTVEQKKKLFEKFSGNFAHLVQHRFASHCCETLFVQSAPVVTEELTADSKVIETDKDEVFVSMENLFLYTLNELEGQMTFLLTDRFASHTLRVLLVILSGRPLEKTSTRTLLQSKKKEKISVTGLSTTPTELSLSKRAVPSSFEFAVEKIISDTIATMDTSFIRILATHPTGNPTLQLLLELELSNPSTKKGSNSDQKTIISSLLPDDIAIEGSEASVFINGILYDAIGSRLLEIIVTHAPGKLFKQIYRTVFKDRIAALARNEIASYVVIRVLNRLSKEDLEEAVTQILPHILALVERSRTMVVKTLLERYHARGADTGKLTEAIASSYGSNPSTLILKMACIDDIDTLIASTTTPVVTTEEGDKASEAKDAPTQMQAPKAIPSQLHGSLLAQSMLTIPGPPSTLIQTSILSLVPLNLLALSLWTTTSHIIQSALLPTNAVSFRRKLINTLVFPPTTSHAKNEHRQSPIITLSLSPIGSHVLDSLLASSAATTPNSNNAPLFSLTERIAMVLSSHESELRESWTGRIVWRNWSLDLFKRRRGDWVRKVKEAGIAASAEAFKAAAASNPVPVDGDEPREGAADNKARGKKGRRGNGGKSGKGGNPADEGKSAIQLAREKFAKTKVAKASGSSNPNGKGKSQTTGANSIVV